jgi:hemoglobin
MDAPTTPYDLIGGAPAVRRLAERFYAVMAEAPEAAAVRAMHGEDLGPIVGKLAGFLSGWMGGPRDYFMRDDRPCVMSLHRALPISARERDEWLWCMQRALAETDVPEEARAALEPAFARIAEAMRTR